MQQKMRCPHLLAILRALEMSQAAHHIGHDALDGLAQDLLVADIDLLLQLGWNPLPHLGTGPFPAEGSVLHRKPF